MFVSLLKMVEVVFDHFWTTGRSQIYKRVVTTTKHATS